MTTLAPFYTSKECDIFYDDTLKVVRTTWKSGIYVKGEAFRIILEEILMAIEKTKSSTVIADARGMNIIAEADRQWIVSDWYPRALQAGFRCQALIVTRDSFNEQAIKLIVSKYNNELVKTHYFIVPEDAEDWVRKGAP